MENLKSLIDVEVSGSALPCTPDCDGREESQCYCCSSMTNYKIKKEKDRLAQLAQIKKEIAEAKNAGGVILKLNEYRRSIEEATA